MAMDTITPLICINVLKCDIIIDFINVSIYKGHIEVFILFSCCSILLKYYPIITPVFNMFSNFNGHGITSMISHVLTEMINCGEL